MTGAGPAPRGAPTFDPAEFAIRAGFEATHYWHVHRREVILREVTAMARPGAHLADVGCGIGTVATHLAAHGFRVDYLDVFEEALAIAAAGARARLGQGAAGLRFLRADATRPLPVSQLDGVLLLDVIEHLDDDREALHHARDALSSRPGAFVLCTVPAFPFLWSPWDETEHHRRRYVRASLERALREAGLEPLRTTYFFAPLFFAALTVKALRAARGALPSAPTPPRGIRDLVESTSHPALDRCMLALTRPERAWLPGRRLPFGTSLLAVARKG